MVLKSIRYILGNIIIAIDYATRPRKMRRSGSEQAQVEQAAEKMSLYQFHLCPFCVKVRRMIHRLNIPMELRDAKRDPQFRQELSLGGGKVQVPCLRIESDSEVKWMYESSAINDYLTQQFGKTITTQ